MAQQCLRNTVYHRDGNKILYGEGFKVVSIAGCWLIEVLNTTRLLESNQYCELRQCLLLEKRFKYNSDVSLSPWIVTTRKRSLGQGNIFRSMCQEFCPQGGVPGQVHPPDQVHPPGTRYTPKTRYTPRTRYTPKDQVHPPWTRYTPWDQVHPLGPGTPPDLVHPPLDQVHPPRPGASPGPGTPPGTRYTPETRYTPWYQVHPPGPGMPWYQVHPPPRTRYTPQTVHAGRYGQQAGGTHPTGMHSCF